MCLWGGRFDCRGVRVAAWPKLGSEAAGERAGSAAGEGPALSIGSLAIAWSSSLLRAWWTRHDAQQPPLFLDLVEVSAVDLRLRREADGALNWANANAEVRRRRSSMIEHPPTSSSEESSEESDAPPVSRFLLPLEDTSSSDDGAGDARTDRGSASPTQGPPQGEYGARWWRRRDVVAIAETCGASYRATKSALERTARRVTPAAAKSVAGPTQGASSVLQLWRV